MLTNDILKYSTDVEMAIVPENVYKHKRNQGIKDLGYEYVRFGKRVDGIHYAPRSRKNSITSYDAEDFYATESKSFAFLFEVTKDDGTKFYCAVKPSAVISTRADYDAYWIPELARQKVAQELAQREQELAQARYERRSKVENERKAHHEAEANGLAESIRQSIMALLGQKAYMNSSVSTRISGTWVSPDTEFESYKVEQLGTVTLEMRDFQRLLEKALKEG